jgi:PAS domain S-box-containing protein
MTTDSTNGTPGATALRKAEELFRAAFDSAPFGIVMFAPDGRILRVNQSLCEMVGYPAEEMLTRTIQDLTHSDDIGAQPAYNEEMLAGKIRTYSMEKRVRHADGHLAWVKVSVSLVRDEDGTPRYGSSRRTPERSASVESVSALVAAR